MLQRIGDSLATAFVVVAGLSCLGVALAILAGEQVGRAFGA